MSCFMAMPKMMNPLVAGRLGVEPDPFKCIEVRRNRMWHGGALLLHVTW